MMETVSREAVVVAADIRASVVIPLHNHELYVGQLLESLFAQWRPGLELVLIDDASTDASFVEVQRILQMYPEIPATVTRMGWRHGMALPQEIVRLARGTIFIRADSDDVAMPGRLDAILACFEDPDCKLVTSNAVLISPESLSCGLYDTRTADAIFCDPLVAAAQEGDARWLGATMAFHRDLYETFPPIDAELCPYGLDLILPLRALLLGTHHYVARPLVGWRQHVANSHRVAGAFRDNPAAQEHYQALILMALAQKVRDVEFLRVSRQDDLLSQTLEACRASFQTKFDHWCRLRHRSTVAAQSAGQRQESSTFKPAVPPIPTLRPGETLRFGRGEAGARFVSRAFGFHEPEPWGVWTQRAAHLNVRIASESKAATELLFKIHWPTTKVSIGIVGRDCTFNKWFDAQGAQTIVVPLDAKLHGSVIGIILLAHEAFVPSVTGDSADHRLLGVSLLSLTVVAEDVALGIT